MASLKECAATILIVDDDEAICGVLAKMLSRFSYNSMVATDAAEALALLKANKEIDLLLSDIHMPAKSGIGLLKEARKIRPELPVVLMTGDAGMEQYLQVMDMGAALYLAKPFQVSDLIRSLENVLGSAAASRDCA